ncbi:MAG TPA: hypothetical protein VG759_03890 [Candidatus Angelobacter sp.]|jgi:hypothetical protein|nr:hypothetical protein [Candidatus Angelobacter sp.]
MNYRHQIQGRYFLVALFFLNIMALLSVVFLITDPTPHERLVVAGMLAYMALNTAGMCWCLWAVLPEPLPTYNRFQNFLYRRRTGKPWLQRAGIVIFAINLTLGIAMRSRHGHHGHLTGQANVSSWITIGSAALVLVMWLWPLPPVKAEQQ